MLSSVTRHIYLAGLSMGGVLALLSASTLPVQGVIAMATPYGLPNDWRINFTPLLSKIQPYLPKTETTPDEGWFDPQAWKDHVSYPQNPVRSIGELKKLTVEMQSALPEVNVPVLLIYSKDDKYLPLGSLNSMNLVYEHLGTTDKHKLVLEGSGHVLTRDAARDSVFKAAADFIERIEMTAG